MVSLLDLDAALFHRLLTRCLDASDVIVSVGAAHLAEPDGLITLQSISLLTANGYKIHQTTGTVAGLR